MKYQVEIEKISTGKKLVYKHINAPSSKLAYQWGQIQGDHKLGKDRGMIEVKKLK